MYSYSNLQTTVINGSVPELRSDYHWYAIYTKSRFEKKVHRDLQQSKYQVFLPLVKEIKKWSDRIKTVNVPLLPGYVFVKLDKQNIPKLFYYPGVVRLVSFESKPCEIREEEIRLLKEITSHGFPVQQAVPCDVGDNVRIVRGPLQGWEGKVETKKGQSRIVFQIASILQCISVEVSMGDVEMIK
ncbi:MAG TPA: UpxY family transcription antiterminator [Saprospiraceae bacterium]|nr:UpxY family transcription antiterminator [Saprospiraceae bacterium]